MYDDICDAVMKSNTTPTFAYSAPSSWKCLIMMRYGLGGGVSEEVGL